MTLLSKVAVVLVEPQNPVNIATCIRAMKNMGVTNLRLVRPVDYDPWRLEGIAHDTTDIIEGIKKFDSLDEALADCVRVAGFTARRRAAKRATVRPDAAVKDILEYAESGTVALVFGREDKGLSNEELDRAHVVVTIPTTDYASLNLAQAVLIALYELHTAVEDATKPIGAPRKDAPPASSEEYEMLFADTAKALETINFFKTRFPEHIMRSVRSLAYRAAPDSREIALLRAISIEVVRTVERIGGKKGSDESA
jgi:TrmH family RNA methyltransferase